MRKPVDQGQLRRIDGETLVQGTLMTLHDDGFEHCNSRLSCLPVQLLEFANTFEKAYVFNGRLSGAVAITAAQEESINVNLQNSPEFDQRFGTGQAKARFITRDLGNLGLEPLSEIALSHSPFFTECLETSPEVTSQHRRSPLGMGLGHAGKCHGDFAENKSREPRLRK